jgi:Tfp pilus assembly protein PilE
MNKKQPPFAFTFGELMAILAVIGVLVTIAFPKYIHYQARAKQAEAKSSLHHMHSLMESYFLTQKSYKGAKLSKIGWVMPIAKDREPPRYNYKLTKVGVKHWSGRALSKAKICESSKGLDFWTIDESEKLVGREGC